LLTDVLDVFTSPAELFRRLPSANRVAAALVLLMVVHAAYGAALASTGVLDYEIDQAAEKACARQRERLGGTETDEKLTAALDAVEKGAVFNKLLLRVGLIGGGPLGLAARLALLAGLLFTAAALGGGKPKYQLVLGITVFAAYVEVPKLLMRLVLVSQLQVGRVETSLAAFATGPDVGLPLYLLLRRLDPFDLWYYGLVALGIWKIGLLSRRSAVLVVGALALLATLLAVLGDVGELCDLSALMTRPAGIDS
jgi:hypothetical protein